MLHNFHLPLKCKITQKIKNVLISQSFKNPLNRQILTQPNVQSSGEKLINLSTYQKKISTGKITDHQNVV